MARRYRRRRRMARRLARAFAPATTGSISGTSFVVSGASGLFSASAAVAPGIPSPVASAWSTARDTLMSVVLGTTAKGDMRGRVATTVKSEPHVTEQTRPAYTPDKPCTRPGTAVQYHVFSMAVAPAASPSRALAAAAWPAKPPPRLLNSPHSIWGRGTPPLRSDPTLFSSSSCSIHSTIVNRLRSGPADVLTDASPDPRW